MAADAYFLTEDDRKNLRLLSDMVKRGVVNPQTRPGNQGIAHQEHQAPETYIAKVKTGGLTAAVDGTPLVLGKGQCDIYRSFRTGADFELRKIASTPRTVFNLSTEEVEEDTWITITRDKFGAWIAQSIGGGEESTGINSLCSWVASLKTTDCLFMEIMDATGECDILDLDQEFTLEHDGIEEWVGDEDFVYGTGSGEVVFRIEKGIPTLQIGERYLLLHKCGVAVPEGGEPYKYIDFLGSGDIFCRNPDSGSGDEPVPCDNNTFRVRLQCKACVTYSCEICPEVAFNRKLCARITDKTGGSIDIWPDEFNLTGGDGVWLGVPGYGANPVVGQMVFRCERLSPFVDPTTTLRFDVSGISFGGTAFATKISEQCTPFYQSVWEFELEPDAGPDPLLTATVTITNGPCSGGVPTPPTPIPVPAFTGDWSCIDGVVSETPGTGFYSSEAQAEAACVACVTQPEVMCVAITEKTGDAVDWPDSVGIDAVNGVYHGWPILRSEDLGLASGDGFTIKCETSPSNTVGWIIQTTTGWGVRPSGLVIDWEVVSVTLGPPLVVVVRIWFGGTGGLYGAGSALLTFTEGGC